MTRATSPDNEMEISSAPTQQQIAARAYSIYEQSGYQQGQCMVNWLQAERELICEAVALRSSESDTHDEDALSTAEVDELVQNAPPRQKNRPLSYAGSGA